MIELDHKSPNDNIILTATTHSFGAVGSVILASRSRIGALDATKTLLANIEDLQNSVLYND